MNSSEALVFRLCTKSFLSIWSYASPRGKDPGKELCDILVVCDPDLIIFSVKDVGFKESESIYADWERWQRKAIEESSKQIYGAERWINQSKYVVTKEGRTALEFPDAAQRQIHRVAVALGGQGKAPLYFGDLGKGFVHVFDEVSLGVVMDELDTISDFVGYLSDKEQLYARGAKTLVQSGGEEDLLALYLQNGREFPDDADSIILDVGLWGAFIGTPEYRSKKEADETSYVWDRLIETLPEDFRCERLVAEDPFSSTTLPDIEKATRVMARENRFCRRLLGKQFIEFLELSGSREVRARIVPSLSGVQYVFLACSHDEERKRRLAELAARCFVVRGLKREQSLVIGIATEQYEPGKGYSLDVLYLNKKDWTAYDQEQLQYLQRELGYFSHPRKFHLREDEYPGQ